MTQKVYTLADLSAFAKLIFLSGEPDTGKTTLAVTAASDPSRIAFFDDDSKASTMHGQLGFGEYHDLTAEFAASDKQRMIDFYRLVMAHVDAIEDHSYDVLIFDNWARMERGIREYSSSIMTEISPLTRGQIDKVSQFTWPYTYNIYDQVLATLMSKAKVVIITTHLKHHMIGQVRTGSMTPRGQAPLVERSNLRLYLRHSQAGPEPVGLVLKRITRMMHVDNAIKAVDVLPRRIEPCTWSTIFEYINDPVGLRETVGAYPSETLSESDLFILDGTLTDDQKHALTVAAADAIESGVLDSGVMTGSQPQVVQQALGQNALAPAQIVVPPPGPDQMFHPTLGILLDQAVNATTIPGGDPPWYTPARLLASQGKSASVIAATLGQQLPLVVIAIKDVVQL